ncbi:MAG: FlgD immunoglobulin-like domain containing protein [Candidatus Neomarinimicrobiota bacterium]
MPFNKITILLIILNLSVPAIINGQCDDDVNQTLSVDDFPIELIGSTTASGDDFVVYSSGSTDTLGGYFTNDVIYKFSIGFSDEDNDGENDEGINLFVDMCNNDVNFDASIAIVKADGIDCKNIDEGELLATEGIGFYYESIDAGALCPSADNFDPASYLPISRDVYLNEEGNYYIVIDGHSSGNTGDFSVVIGEMSHFSDYKNLHPQNFFVDIDFSNEVYGVNDGEVWSIGSILNGEDYFEIRDENGFNVGLGELLNENGGLLQQNTGYSTIRFPLINPPNYGSYIYVTVKNHIFATRDENGEIIDQTTAPHLINSEGIPFTIGDTIYIDLYDIIPPQITIEGISVESDPLIVDPNENIIIYSSEELFKNQEEISEENLSDYILLSFLESGDPIGFSVDASDNLRVIEIDPFNSFVDAQWEDIQITLLSQNTSGVSLNDESGNQITTKTSDLRINDIVSPLFDNAVIDSNSNTLVTISMSEEIYKDYEDLVASGGLNTGHFDLAIIDNELNNVNTVLVENVIKVDSFEPVVGGETSLRLQLILDPPNASGAEVIAISTTFFPIRDRAGNQVLNQVTFNLKDELAPTLLQLSPDPDNAILPSSNIVLLFSETLKIYNISDSSINDLNDSEFKKIVHLINQNGDTLNYQTDFNIDTTSITIDPDTLFTELETFTLSINSSSLCDSDTNFTSTYNFEFEVADVSPPSFISDSFGRGNDYVLIQMSENVFSNSEATEPLSIQDFTLEVDYGDLNGAQSIYIESIADTSGGNPIIGETIFRLNLKVVGSANGTENILIRPTPNEIYDAGGNIMSATEVTEQFHLLPSPIFSQNSSLSPDNGFFRLIFENGPVFSNELSSSGLVVQDFKVILNLDSGQISEVLPLYVVDMANNWLDNSGADTIKLDVNLDFIPTGGEIIRIFPESSNAIYNETGVNMDSSEFAGPFILNDQLRPFYSSNITNESNNISYNDTLIFSFNEPIRLLNGQPLTDDSALESFKIMDVFRYEDIVVSTPDSTLIIPPDSAIDYVTYYTIVNDPSPDSIWVIMTQPFGSEHVMSVIIEDNFEDFSGNQILAKDTITFTTSDNIAPNFISGSAKIDSNLYISLQNNPSEASRKICAVHFSIDDNVFTDNSGLNSLIPSDFSVEIFQNNGFVSSANIEDIEVFDHSDEGKDSVRLQIKFDEVPSGKEKFLIRPANNSAIYDLGLNAMSIDSTTDTLLTYDLRFPTIDSTDIQHEGFVDLVIDSVISIYFSEPIDVESFSYKFTSKRDTLGFNYAFRLNPDTLFLILDSTIMSYDTLDFEVLYIKDTSGNVRDSLLSRRFFTKAAGDFSDPPDDRISLEDLAVFISSWNSNDFSKNLGPYTGNPPNIKISQDSLFGIDDGMAFTQMWRWSIEKYGPVYLGDKNKNSSDIALLQISNDRISIFATQSVKYGQLILEYGSNLNSVDVIRDFQLNSNGVILNDINHDDGIAIIEFAISEDTNSPLGFDFEASTIEDIDVRVTYALFDGNYNLLEKKDSIVNRVYIPEKFSLKQNYPNPFNPKTTIRFSLPVDSNVELIIYDVNGKIVKEIINNNMETGSYKVVWDGTNKSGAGVGSGVYLYRIKADNFIASQKMIFLK